MGILNKAIIPAIIAILLLCASNTQWSKDNWTNIIEADGKGYYAYLPAVFIYQDLNFTFFDSIEKKYPNPRLYYDYRAGERSEAANKYFVGTAVTMMPFFLIAHTISKSLDFEADGYSKIYPVMINIAAIFYLALGLYYLKKILQRYNASSGLIAFILISITFATNVFYYAVCEPAMSHIYSFAFITMFIYYLHLFYNIPKMRTYFIICILFGIVVLIRPVNGLIVLVAPFVAGDRSLFFNGLIYLKERLARSVFGVILAFAIIAIQVIIYKIQTGYFMVDSYGSESFNWIAPHPIDFLVSYKKGLFVYTPLAFLSLLGLYQLYKQNKFQFYSLSVFLIVLVYVLSSWWSWWYGGSFSSRVCIEYYAILALLICFAYSALKTNWSRKLYSVLIFCSLLVCQVQTYQYRYYIIHWEKMDKEHYWRVFMRVDQLGSDNPNADLLE